ncbi:MAG: DUF397 domain-containing protein [Streptosporangiaceae bacterium]
MLRAEWHKSSYSSQDGNCVEVARNLPGLQERTRLTTRSAVSPWAWGHSCSSAVYSIYSRSASGMLSRR